MLIVDTFAAVTGAALVWAGATGRLTTIVTDSETGRDMPSGLGNSLAVGGGLCVIVSAVFG